MSNRYGLAAAAAAALIAAGPAQGATLVIGNGLAAECSQGAYKGRADKEVLDTCTAALEGQLMPKEDTAKTYVNRGVVYLRRGVYDLAEKDFDSADRLVPLPETHINLGAVRIREKRYEEAVAEINKGLEMGPLEPEKGYYNRAVAKEALDDLQGAYLDFRKASELKPDWADPKNQMARFIVETR
jgi:tetratricopeptide (TPR) repeat protein